MIASVENGTIILREWESSDGLTETEHSFATIDELFSLCLDAGDPQLVDRILLRGTDENGALRTITFGFQSLTQG